MTNITSVKMAVDLMGEERTLRLVQSALRAQERSKEQGKKDRALLKALKSGEISFGSSRVDMTSEVGE